ncbi:MAG: ABC transporter permease [Acidimicrobiales bacterium]
MAEAMAALAVYRRLLAARVRSEWQYRTTFVLLLTSSVLVATFDFAVITVIFGQVDRLAGWSVEEVALLFGLGGVGFGLADVFIGQVDYAASHIKAGTFDQFLLRPLGPLLQLSAAEFNFRRFGRVLQPAVVLAIALTLVEVDWTVATAMMVPLAVVSGTAIFGAVWVITASMAFWTVDTQEFANVFTYGGNHLIQYPIDLLGAWLRRVTVFVVPLAFVAYFPSGLAWLSPVVAATMVLLAGRVWTTAIRHYRSTGS